jgi:hypothetical protein
MAVTEVPPPVARPRQAAGILRLAVAVRNWRPWRRKSCSVLPDPEDLLKMVRLGTVPAPDDEPEVDDEETWLEPFSLRTGAALPSTDRGRQCPGKRPGTVQVSGGGDPDRER